MKNSPKRRNCHRNVAVFLCIRIDSSLIVKCLTIYLGDSIICNTIVKYLTIVLHIILSPKYIVKHLTIKLLSIRIHKKTATFL